MCHHNFILEQGITNQMDLIDRDVFNDKVLRYFALHPCDPEWIYGGDANVCRVEDGNILHGGHPTSEDAKSTESVRFGGTCIMMRLPTKDWFVL